jgi:spermidine synthase
MSRWDLIDSTPVPDGSEELLLYQRSDEFAIRVRGHGELMNSRTHGSEDALGALPCASLSGVDDARILIGGLGMGFTLAAALESLPASAHVDVAELVPAVVRWNRDHLGHCAGHPLRDPRVAVHERDVADMIGAENDHYDAILLDVDNGPEGLTQVGNHRLYSLTGLMRTWCALRPNGVLAVWSAGPDRPFTARLVKSGFGVEERWVRAHGNKGSRHLIWLAAKHNEFG